MKKLKAKKQVSQTTTASWCDTGGDASLSNDAEN